MMKQAILVRTDLNMSAGKIAAQASHASVQAVLNSQQRHLTLWTNEGMKKIVLQVANEKELLRYHQKARRKKLVSVVITDGGHTEVPPGTKTCAAIGPAQDEQIDAITGALKTL